LPLNADVGRSADVFEARLKFLRKEVAVIGQILKPGRTLDGLGFWVSRAHIEQKATKIFASLLEMLARERALT
jgi:hypothetical protein